MNVGQELRQMLSPKQQEQLDQVREALLANPHALDKEKKDGQEVQLPG